MKEVLDLAREENLFVGKRVGISILEVSNPQNGIEIAKKVIYKISDPTTILFLSGGSTPKPLYADFAKEGILKVAAAALIDERFGKKLHDFSNEKMIKETGLLDYFASQNTRLYPINLDENLPFEETSAKYDEKVRKLFFAFPKSVALLGIGPDGHTAGIAPNRNGFVNPIFSEEQKDLFVSHFNDGEDQSKGGFGNRITLTFKGLAMLDVLIIMAFGENKKRALEEMFKEGRLDQIPSRFYANPLVSEKTLLITDQKI